MNAHVRLCHADEVPEGSSRGFDPAGSGRDALFVVRRASRVHAWLDACPHWRGAPMAWRKDAYLSGDRTAIVCAAHGARFDIASGLCTLGPCLGQSLTRVPLIENESGELLVQLPLPTFEETNP
ncbi:Rieske (2Fe-2S) protein [Ramlibacter sp. AW1]|uniref:Rieske (2Fe-2S) protein n=1 Tax=Ramlibacter aurantiacus TaxID=2801330 RepID=A0A936ZHX5_9BURK|nr:Rieske (2Fe-2S) protein [Ramlibacter aurantiacus]MBL0420182.1 Rieske (2Fe-2S) protein [Ramlibacter aurantiacus]